MITEKMIPEIENVFYFHLYDWQRDYLLEKALDIPWGQGIRRKNGKTFIYCVKLLLSDGEPIKPELLECGRYADEFHGKYYRIWFAKYLLDIDRTLKEAGFKTRIQS